MNLRTAFASALLVPAVLFANQLATVDAGKDTTVRVGWPNWRFYATVNDPDGTFDYTVKWTQMAGPDSGVVLAADYAEASSVDFRKTGSYTFRITVTDSGAVAFDDINITVIDSIPFVVLYPKAGTEVLIGAPLEIRWQYDPPATVAIDLSLDDGATYTFLEQAQISGTSYVWNVPDSQAISNACRLRVYDYHRHVRATISGKFSIVTKLTAQPAKKKGCGSGVGLALIPPIAFKIASSRRKRKGGAQRKN